MACRPKYDDICRVGRHVGDMSAKFPAKSAGTFWVSSITADLLDGGRDRLARGRGRLRDVEGGSVSVVTAGVVPVGG